MNNLTLITSEKFPIYRTSKGNRAVNARELHQWLGVKEKFADWMRRKIVEHQFVSGTHFYCPNMISEKSEIKKRGGDQKSVVYILSEEAAKIIAMGTNNAKGDEVKQYFLACERAAVQMIAAASLPHDANDIIEHHRSITLSHTGRRPNEWRAKAKEMGIKATLCRSGREALRQLAPAKACVISLTENLYAMGYTEEQAIEISKAFEGGFQKMLDNGAIPHELKAGA